MTLTIGQILALSDSGALNSLASQKQLPALTAFRIGRLMRKLLPEMIEANRQRYAMFNEMNSVPVFGDPTRRQIKPDWMEAFELEIGPLLAGTVTIEAEAIYLQSLERATLSAIEAQALEPLIAE